MCVRHAHMFYSETLPTAKVHTTRHVVVCILTRDLRFRSHALGSAELILTAGGDYLNGEI